MVRVIRLDFSHVFFRVAFDNVMMAEKIDNRLDGVVGIQSAGFGKRYANSERPGDTRGGLCFKFFPGGNNPVAILARFDVSSLERAPDCISAKRLSFERQPCA